eukprot:11463875-Karenia_brevis.AAC.1
MYKIPLQVEQHIIKVATGQLHKAVSMSGDFQQDRLWYDFNVWESDWRNTNIDTLRQICQQNQQMIHGNKHMLVERLFPCRLITMSYDVNGEQQSPTIGHQIQRRTHTSTNSS